MTAACLSWRTRIGRRIFAVRCEGSNNNIESSRHRRSLWPWPIKVSPIPISIQSVRSKCHHRPCRSPSYFSFLGNDEDVDEHFNHEHDMTSMDKHEPERSPSKLDPTQVPRPTEAEQPPRVHTTENVNPRSTRQSRGMSILQTLVDANPPLGMWQATGEVGSRIPTLPEIHDGSFDGGGWSQEGQLQRRGTDPVDIHRKRQRTNSKLGGSQEKSFLAPKHLPELDTYTKPQAGSTHGPGNGAPSRYPVPFSAMNSLTDVLVDATNPQA